MRGQKADAEVHLVCRSDTNHLAVVALLLTEDEVAEDSVLQNLLAGRIELPDLASSGPMYLLPGSLTSGPDFKAVQWIVLETPLKVKTAELEEFRRRGLFQPVRGLQPIQNRMIVYVSR